MYNAKSRGNEKENATVKKKKMMMMMIMMMNSSTAAHSQIGIISATLTR
jgi:hypothetical protein